MKKILFVLMACMCMTFDAFAQLRAVKYADVWTECVTVNVFGGGGCIVKQHRDYDGYFVTICGFMIKNTNKSSNLTMYFQNKDLLIQWVEDLNTINNMKASERNETLFEYDVHIYNNNKIVPYTVTITKFMGCTAVQWFQESFDGESNISKITKHTLNEKTGVEHGYNFMGYWYAPQCSKKILAFCNGN